MIEELLSTGHIDDKVLLSATSEIESFCFLLDISSTREWRCFASTKLTLILSWPSFNDGTQSGSVELNNKAGLPKRKIKI